AFGVIAVLPAAAAGPVSVDAQLGLVDLDIDIVVDLWINPDRGEAGVAAGVAVVGADSHQPVDPAFGLQIAVGILALDQQGRRLDPRLLARMWVDHLDLHSL